MEKKPAAKGTALDWNDILQTGRSGRVRIQLNDQSILTLGSDSTLRVVKHDAAHQQTALQLGYGRIRCEVTKLVRSGGNFELTTPTAVAGVIGTDFGADASFPGETRFICISGTVRVRNNDPSVPGSVDCAPGMTTTVRIGSPPATPVPADSELVQRWQHITAPADPRFGDTVVPLNDAQLFNQVGDHPAFPWLPEAMPVKPIRWRGLSISGTWRLRLENWNWFEDGSASNTYSFLQSILRVEIAQRRKDIEWHLELAQPSLLGLPNNAVATGSQGQLGLGATYYTINGNSRNAAYIFPSLAFIQFRHLAGGDRNWLRVGRFSFVDGMEMIPQNQALAWLKQVRIAHRLLGDFQWTVTGRSQDGLWLSWKLGNNNLTLAAARPTRGVYQADGLGSLDAGWAYGAVTVPTGSGNSVGDLRIFALGYEDARALAKTDNRPAAIRNGVDKLSNIRIGTFGAHYLHAISTKNAGKFDFLFWGAGQTGSWGVQSHRAGAVTVEAGWQPKAPRLKPWLRLGYLYSSGDGNPSDNQHNTFFQVLPTPRVYSRFPFYSYSNLSDASAMLILRPSPKFTLRTEGHALSLASRHDLWYLGGGAAQPHVFGYQGRPSSGNRGLSNLWDISGDYQFNPHFGIGTYYAHAWGKGVVKSLYPSGPNSNFGYIEMTYRF